MKKRMTALFLTAAMAAAVAGCSQKTTEVKDTSAAAVSSEAKQEEGTKASADGKESQAAGEKVKISYLSRFTNPELPRAKYYMEKLEEFRAANPDIEVEDVSIADAESYKSSLKASVAAGSPPTLFICSDAFPHYDWAKNGVIKDLTPMIESADWTGPADEGVFGSFSFERSAEFRYWFPCLCQYEAVKRAWNRDTEDMGRRAGDDGEIKRSRSIDRSVLHGCKDESRFRPFLQRTGGPHERPGIQGQIYQP